MLCRYDSVVKIVIFQRITTGPPRIGARYVHHAREEVFCLVKGRILLGRVQGNMGVKTDLVLL